MNGRKKGPDWKGIVINHLYLRDYGKCELCGLEIERDHLFEIDHIIERSEGGMDTLDNLRIVHIACHKERHTNGQRIIPAAIMRRAKIKYEEDKEEINTEYTASGLRTAAEKKILILVKSHYIDKKNLRKAAEACGLTVDSLKYRASKYGLKGKPSEWSI